MRVNIHISEAAYQAISAEAKARAMTESALMRERLDVSFGIRTSKPRRLAMRRVFNSQREEE